MAEIIDDEERTTGTRGRSLKGGGKIFAAFVNTRAGWLRICKMCTDGETTLTYEQGENNMAMQHMELVYLKGHHWGIEIDGILYKEYENFDAAADDYEAMGGVYLEGDSD